jgi:hypothetical protein
MSISSVKKESEEKTAVEHRSCDDKKERRKRRHCREELQCYPTELGERRRREDLQRAREEGNRRTPF